jgi:large conductance mechanosensitive channel
MPRSRKATVADVHELAQAMPYVTVTYGDSGNAVYQVGQKSFVFFRNRRPDAYDPETGERYDDVIVVAVGLVVATAFSTLIKSFTDSVILPVIARIGGGNAVSFGIPLGAKGNHATTIDVGAFISAIIYFIIFMAVVYFLIVVPYKRIQARRGVTVFGDPTPAKTCPHCLSNDIPVEATKCKYCTSELTVE